MNIEAGAPADDAGLRRGDLISEINRLRISNLNDFNRIIARIKPGDNALLFVNRAGRKFYTTLEP
jgi:serine protease Do